MSLVDELSEALEGARRRSLDLLSPLPEDALCAQHSPLMSPLVWDLAHIGNYEDLWLIRHLGAAAVRPEIDELYDAFLQPRARRPQLPLLSPREARDYLARVRDRSLAILSKLDLASPITTAGRGGGAPRTGGGAFRTGSGRRARADNSYVHRMVIQHEHQHDETMLATLQLSGLEFDHAAPTPPIVNWRAAGEVRVAAGAFTMGTDLDLWALDNERPAHSVDVAEFFVDVAPVDNAAWIEFIEDGGYTNRALWAEDGWAWREKEGLEAPLFWVQDRTGNWHRSGFGRMSEVAPTEPVQHVCWHEAAAFALWAGRRLPTEQEWEKANSTGALQGVGHGWEWTASDFLPFPGFRAFPYREYSEAFFGAGYKVLRGSSWATHATVARPTFRNWDYPIRRQIFCGLRTARDG